MNIEKIDRTIEFNIAFDVLDAAIHRCLSNTMQGFVEFKREEPTRATVIYILGQYQLGIFGKIRIDKLSSKRTDMSLFQVIEPFAPKQKQEFFEGDGSLKNRAAKLLAEGLNHDESISHRRRKHYDNVIESLLNKLDQENIWAEEQTDNEILKGDITIGKNVTHSNIINGNNNVININKY
jgi:hypothetical protein